MKKVFEETAKYLYDISKIVLTIGAITPFFKDGTATIGVIVGVAVLWALGSIIYYLGDKQ